MSKEKQLGDYILEEEIGRGGLPRWFRENIYQPEKKSQYRY